MLVPRSLRGRQARRPVAESGSVEEDPPWAGEVLEARVTAPLPNQSESLLLRIDSIASLVAHRHPGALPADVRDELLSVSQVCRKLAEAAHDRDALAVLVAEAWWPDRYVGDLSTAEWRQVYEALERPA